MAVLSVSTLERIAALAAGRDPFVHATVVRAQRPSSARAGDQAIVHPDGRIEGFVGGQCAAGSVRAAALEALATGEGVLLRVLPDGSEHFPDTPGASVVVNHCLSGGALEIFLDPVLPPSICHVVGTSPIARAVGSLAEQAGFEVAMGDDAGPPPAGTVASIVSSHGGAEPQAIRTALDAGVPFVGLVASAKRGAAVLAELDLDEFERARVHTPVGLDIGAQTPGEIGLSILARVVQAVRVDGGRPAAVVGAGPSADRSPAQAVDPVCGMTVTVVPDTPHAVVGGQDYWFCRPGCRDRYVAER